MVNRIVLNETSYFGRGSRYKLKEELIKRNHKKILVVTDTTLIENAANSILNDLKESNLVCFTYTGVRPNPTIENVQSGLMIAQINNVDAVVAIGGGSVIDTAKAISIIIRNPEHGDVSSLEGAVETKNKNLPLFAIPTTSGTAAEVTINYVITDEIRKKKMVCIDPHDIPLCSFIDPDLMETMPQQLAATTGMDALTHAIEGYITRASWLMTDMYHVNAMSLLYKNLEKAVNEKNKDAIEKVAYAQYIAGMGFSNVGLGIVHSMAHALGAIFDTPHGLANAILLPHVLRYNGKSCKALYRNMANVMGIDITNLNDDEVIEKIATSISELSKKMKIPQTLKEIGISKEIFKDLATLAINDPCTPGNPRTPSIEEIIEIYNQAY